MTAQDTIFALGSGAGMAGIAVIRMSGARAGDVLEAMAAGRPEPRMMALRRIIDPANGEILDEGLILWLPGPASFTGEDMAELHVHGSRAVVSAVLNVLGRQKGLRAAEAGEFTRRAFRNGRIDLVEAEGLADLIRSRTAAQRRQALEHMLGSASEHYEAWRKELILCLGRIEAAVDFIDEEDVARRALAEIDGRLWKLRSSIAAAIGAARQGMAIREGVKVVLAGPPNTGKSSLLNRIAQREAAIVSARAGTTRDVIEVPLDLDGIPVILTDTAGLRAGSADEIEAEGMSRTRNELSSADIAIWVSSPDVADPADIMELDSDAIRLLNKCDLDGISRLNRNESKKIRHYHVSAKTGEGISEFIAALSRRVKDEYGSGDPAVVIRERHVQSLERCWEAIVATIDSPTQQIEIVAENLRNAATELGRITGRIDVEDLLDSIFREFCIGK